MIRALTTSILIGLASLMAGCSTYVENEASLAFEPIYPSAHVTPEGEGPTGGIFKSSGGGLFASDIRARDDHHDIFVRVLYKLISVCCTRLSCGLPSSSIDGCC